MDNRVLGKVGEQLLVSTGRQWSTETGSWSCEVIDGVEEQGIVSSICNCININTMRLLVKMPLKIPGRDQTTRRNLKLFLCSCPQWVSVLLHSYLHLLWTPQSEFCYAVSTLTEAEPGKPNHYTIVTVSACSSFSDFFGVWICIRRRFFWFRVLHQAHNTRTQGLVIQIKAAMKVVIACTMEVIR